jgi:ribosomal protein L24
MSRKFLTNIDLNNNLLINPVLNNTHGANTTAGALYYSSGKLTFGNGTGTPATVATMTDTVTVGTTAITIGSSATTIAGLNSVTSTTFVGALTGTASNASQTTGTLTFGTGLTAGGSSFNGSTNITITPVSATTSVAGIVQLSDSTSTTSSVLAATATAAKAAFDRGTTGVNDAATAQSTANAALARTGGTMTGAINMGGSKITNLGTPTDDADAATKLYVDTIATGLHVHPSVNYATTGALGTAGNLVGGTITTTYNNGTNGAGATLTIATSSNWTSILVDNRTVTAGDRILIKNQGGTASNLQNGIYTVTSVGAVGNTTSFVFTRALDADQSPEIDAGDLTYVIAGDANGGDGYVQATNGVTVGTTAIQWTQFSGSGAVPLATVSAPGIASFPDSQFNVNGAGAVSIDNLGTLAGTFSTSGANALTLTTTNTTNATIPAGTVTLVDLASSQALTNKTYNGLTVTANGTNTLNITAGKTLAVQASLTFTGTDSSSVAFGAGGTVLYNGGALGTPSSANLSNATNLPISGIASLGTGVGTALAVAIGSAGAFVTFNGALGTPSSGTLTNATGLPISGLVASTSAALGVGTIELGHASDTTISRASAGRIAVEGVNIVTVSSSDTLTNKTLTSPTLDGTPTAPTAIAGTNTPQIATTAFVTAAVGSGLKKYSALNTAITPSGSPGQAEWVITAGTHGIGAVPSLQVQVFQVSNGELVDVDVLVAQ